MRTARLTLRRINKHGKRVRTRVSVRQITVGGYLSLVRSMAPRVAEAMVKSEKPLTDIELIHACATSEAISLFADLVCVNKPVGFIKRWCGNQIDGTPEGLLVRGNVEALLAASRDVEGDGQWTRFLGCLNRGPQSGETVKQKKQRGGGLYADVLDVARIFNVLPQAVMEQPLRDFLDLCDGLNMASANQPISDPTLDPESEASESIPIPGLWKVH